MLEKKMGCGWVAGGGSVGGFLRIMPLRGSILQAGTCQIFSLAENPRWSRVWQYRAVIALKWIAEV